MAVKTGFISGSRNANDFYPEEDVIRRTEDGREIVIARKGTPMTTAKARQLGLIKTEEASVEESADKSKGSKGAAENKAKTPAKNKGGEE